ncbi:MAG: nucleoside triphosphate pyrophosphatase, partial [Gammaproteobacteria bacterium]
MIYLASKSPRRKELLQQLGISFEIIDAGIEEIPGENESATEYVQRVAMDKARAGKQLASGTHPVLAADTEVVVDGRIFGKPADLDEAVAMLQSLSGRMHIVYTAVALLDQDMKILLNENRVWFRPLRVEECEEYCRKYRPLDKAGSYGVQDKGAG